MSKFIAKTLTAGLMICPLFLPVAALSQTATPTLEEPGPRLVCVIEALQNCVAGKDCKRQSEFEGVKLPLRISVDVDANVIAFPVANGLVEVSKIDSAALAGEQWMIQGFDPDVSWQLVVHAKEGDGGSHAMSASIAAADALAFGFGTCKAPM